MKTVTYNGFQAAVEYDDGVLFVRVLHVEDLLVAQCRSVDEIQVVLKELIEDYLEDCRALGKEPSKSYSGTFNIRVGADLHRRAAIAAAEAGVNLNVWVQSAISDKLDCDRIHTRVEGVFEETLHAIRNVQKSAYVRREGPRPNHYFGRNLETIFSSSANFMTKRESEWAH